MTAIIVSGQTTFGAMSNRLAANLAAVNEEITRLQAAAAAASSGYTGTAGTEFEGNSTNFGVAPSATPGAQGLAWQFALGTVNTAWTTFLGSAQGAITALDNGLTVQP